MVRALVFAAEMVIWVVASMADKSPIEKTKSGSVITAALLFVSALVGTTALTIWYIHNASTDVVFSDLWGHLGMIEHFLVRRLSLDEIFLPHNQNRPALLNIVLLISTQYDHLNLQRVKYLGLLFPVMTIAFLFFASKPLFEGRRVTLFLVFSCITTLMLSLAQWESFLLPINFVFFSTITFSVGSILLMGRHLSRPISRVLSAEFIAATMLSELALFSMGGGVLVWFINLMQIMLSRTLHRRRVGSVLFVYGCIGLLSLAVYLHHLGASGSFGFVLSHPVEFLEFVLIGFGSSVVGFFKNTPLVWTAFAMGVVVLAVYCVVLVEFFRLPVSGQRQTLAIFCLVLLGIAEELLIGLGRVPLGAANAAASRYSTLTMISVAASLIFLAFMANRSRAYSTMAVLFGVGICAFVALADYSEVLMAKYRRQYVENLQQILRQGQIGENEMHLLEWHQLSDIQNGNRILRRFRLSFYHNDLSVE